MSRRTWSGRFFTLTPGHVPGVSTWRTVISWLLVSSTSVPSPTSLTLYSTSDAIDRSTYYVSLRRGTTSAALRSTDYKPPTTKSSIVRDRALLSRPTYRRTMAASLLLLHLLSTVSFKPLKSTVHYTATSNNIKLVHWMFTGGLRYDTVR